MGWQELGSYGTALMKRPTSTGLPPRVCGSRKGTPQHPYARRPAPLSTDSIGENWNHHYLEVNDEHFFARLHYRRLKSVNVSALIGKMAFDGDYEKRVGLRNTASISYRV